MRELDRVFSMNSENGRILRLLIRKPNMTNNAKHTVPGFLFLLLLLVGNWCARPATGQQADPPYRADLRSSESGYGSLSTTPPRPFPPADEAGPGPQPDASFTPEPTIEQATFVEGETPTLTTITQSDIDAKVKEVTEAANLDEATRKEALERLKSATEWLKTAKEAAEKPQQYQADILAAPNDLQAAKQALANPRVEPQFSNIITQPLKEIETSAAESEERLKLAKETLTKKEETLKRRSARRADLPKLIPETEKAYEEAKKAMAAAHDVTSPLDMARRLETEARYLALERQRTLFPLESKRLDALAELTPLQRDMAKRDVEFAEKEAAGWQKYLADARKRDSEREAEKARRQLQDADPALKSLAERNTELAERRKSLVALIETTASEVKQATQDAEKVRSDYEAMEKKVEKAGNSATIGLQLRRQREQLPALKDCRERLRFVSRETPIVHLSLLNLQDEQELLNERDDVVAGVIARLDRSARQYDDAYFSKMVDELLTTKEELLDKLVNDHDQYLKLLGELEVAQQEMIAATRQSQAFIDERVLWIRSSEPIGLTHFNEAWVELQDLAKPAEWGAIVTAVKNRAARKPLLAILAFLVVLLMFSCRRRFRRQVNRICERDPADLQGRFSPTIEAIVATALATAFWPGLMWLMGWQLMTIHGMPALGIAIGLGLRSAAYVFWLCLFTKQLCRRDGIATRHFLWNGVGVARARRNLTWLSAIGIPCVFFLAAVTYYREGEWSSFLGRVGFLIGMAALAVFGHATLRVRRGDAAAASGRADGSGSVKMRYAVHVLGLAIPVSLAMLVAIGYDYTAQHIALRLQATLGVLLAVCLGRAVALRWLAVRKFRLQAAAVAEQEAQAAGHEHGPTAGPPAAPTISDDNSDSELRYLLRYAVAGALLVGGYFVWSDVTPALGVLDNVVLSTETVEIKQTVTDLDGKAKVLTSTKDVHTTLKHAVLACLLLGLGLLVARNLPALVDVLILERMPIDKGQRYAAAMILRYVLTLATMIMACLLIGLDWSSIQWLAAAMTVGLGFGLQEIFANLVSGLIILFERPIRVGDLVTVGGVSGRVTRMQIRATTITGFDRKELIVPNKKFITEDVMNWTLTDDVNRVEIEVGIAYGSDTELARELLLKVARQNAFVMTDPEPLAVFDRFADSSLHLTLRCFLPNLDNRLAVIHELHSEINREFREANIEIAFPQQDLHVRSIDAPLRSLLRRDDGRKGAA